MNPNCECSDPGCPACRGECSKRAVTVVLRVDMHDESGTVVCRKCAEDCLESGLFRVPSPSRVRRLLNAPR